MRLVPRLSLLALALPLLACDPQPACEEARLEPLTGDPALVILTTDYQSTAVAIADAEGNLLTEAWLDSGSVVTEIGSALSGDVALPTQALGARELTLIDRLGTDVITRVSIPDGEVLGQLRTRSNMGGTGGYRANPQDVVVAAGGRLVATRHEPNLLPGASELDGGNDLVVLDPTSGTPVERFALSEADVSIDGVHYLARPQRLVAMGDWLIVGLARLDRSFMHAGPGAVAFVHLGRREMQLLPLEGLSNCGHVVPVPGDSARALVQCAGPTFEHTDAARRSGVGIGVLRATETELAVEEIYRAQDHPDLPPPSSGLVSLGALMAVAVAPGSRSGGTPDRLLRIDLESGAVEQVLESEPFALGQGALHLASGTLWIPDADRGVRRYRVGASELQELTTMVPSPCRGLPARAAGLL